MKIYAIVHDGVLLTGYSIVVANDEQEAREMVLEEMSNRGLGFDIYRVCEIDPTTPSLLILWDGDY